MVKTIAVLEDDKARVAAMTAWLQDRFPGYTVRVWANSQAMCQALAKIWNQVVLMSLDHDLAVESDGEGRLVDQGTGQEVVDYLVQRSPAFPVVLHSTNNHAVERMERRLRKRGWQTARVTPFGDLEWIAQAWWPAVRQILVNRPGKDMRLRPVGVFPFRVSQLVRRLIVAVQQSVLADMNPTEEQLLRRWLAYVLVKMPRLIAYINWLRAELGTFPSLELPPQATAALVLASGLQALERIALMQLALNPIALFHFHDRIREEKPAAWQARKPRQATPSAAVSPGRPTIYPLRLGEARQLLAAGSDASGYGVFENDLSLSWSGNIYQGKLQWNCKREGKSDTCYLRMELKGLRDSALAAQLRTPILIVRSPLRADAEGSGRLAWREEIPLTWEQERGTLVSAWRLVRATPQDAVELELSMGPSSTAQSAGRIYDDASASQRRCRLPSPPTRPRLPEGFTMIDPMARQTRCQAGQVAFTVIGEPLPDRALFGAEATSFARAAGRFGRDWIFHLQIHPRPFAASNLSGDWEGIVATEQVQRLSRLLNLRQHFRVEPLEFLPGREPEPRFRSPWVFTQPLELTGRSMDLALAAGLASADQGRAIPPWVLMSATVAKQRAEETPVLGPVTHLKRKLKLALGIGEGNAQIPELLDEVYREDVATYLGPRQDRTVSGGVRLFLGPPSLDASDLGELQTSCQMLEVPLSVRQLRELFQPGPPRTVHDLAVAAGFALPSRWPADNAHRTDWMLFVQVRTLADALKMLGLRRPRSWSLSPRPLCCQLILPRRTATGQRVRDGEDWKNRGRVLREYVDLRMQTCSSLHEQLRVLLQVFINELSQQPGLEDACFNGTVGYVSKDRKLLVVLERVAGPKVDPELFSTHRLFRFYGTDFGPTMVALSEKRASFAPDFRGDPTIQKYLEHELTDFARHYRIPAALVPQQARFLRSIGSYVCVPVIDPASPEPIGAISLLLNRPTDADQIPKDLLHLFEKLAKAALRPLQEFATQEEVVPPNWSTSAGDSQRQSNLFGDPEYLTCLSAREANLEGPLHDFRCARARDLARQICGLPNVYRAAVRLLDPKGTLSVIGSHGEFDQAWLEHPVVVLGIPEDKVDSTGGYAIRVRHDVFLDDTSYRFDLEGRAIPHCPVKPPSLAHAAVLLQFCGQILGVLSVDFHTKHIPPAIRTALRDQANQFALVFKACRIDDEFAQLERPDVSPRDCLEHVARMIGAQFGALFIRNLDSGLYVPQACVGQHTRRWQTKWFQRYGAGIACGKGLIGWVAKHDKSLRMANAWRVEELILAGADTEIPHWIDRAFSEEEFGTQPIAYLGVPVSAGEVHAVMRFINPSNSPGCGFTTYDEQVAKAAASRLALKFQQQRSDRRSEGVKKLFELFWQLPQAERGKRQQCLAQKVFEVLKEAIGECSCGIRLADEVVLANGLRRRGLRRLDCSDPAWHKITPLYRYEPTSLSMSCFLGQVDVIDLEDWEQAKYFAGQPDPQRSRYGHLFLCRLGNEAGAIHVMRPQKGQLFAEADKKFVRRLAELIGPVMKKITEDEQAYLENGILKRLVHPCERENLVACLVQVLRDLKLLLQPAWSGVWIRQGEEFVLYCGQGRPLTAPPLSLSRLLETLGPKGPRLVTFLPEEPAQRTVLEELLPASANVPENWSERDRAALPLRDGEGSPWAVFVFVAWERETMSVLQLDHLTEFLQCLRGIVEKQRLGTAVA